MTDIARTSGLGRQSLYKALSAEGHPEIATVLKVIQTMGFRVPVVPDHRLRDGRAAGLAGQQLVSQFVPDGHGSL